jgi:hypothetical protein
MRVFRKVRGPERDEGSEQLGYLKRNFVLSTCLPVWMSPGLAVNGGGGGMQNLLASLPYSQQNSFFHFWYY